MDSNSTRNRRRAEGKCESCGKCVGCGGEAFSPTAVGLTCLTCDRKCTPGHNPRRCPACSVLVPERTAERVEGTRRKRVNAGRCPYCGDQRITSKDGGPSLFPADYDEHGTYGCLRKQVQQLRRKQWESLGSLRNKVLDLLLVADFFGNNFEYSVAGEPKLPLSEAPLLTVGEHNLIVSERRRRGLPAQIRLQATAMRHPGEYTTIERPSQMQ